MRLELTPRALREAKRRKTWWLENRPKAPDLFDEELTEVLERISITPTLGAAYPAKLEVPVRRVLMEKTKTHVYFAVRDEVVYVLSLWGAQRRRGPKL
jgi:plasmid stabilization system protein ParE